MALLFEWDGEKARQNLAKHSISFEEAATVLGDPLSLTIEDSAHSTDEDRLITIGNSAGQRLLVVAHVERGERIRIISARRATRHERLDYEQGQ